MFWHWIHHEFLSGDEKIHIRSQATTSNAIRWGNTHLPTPPLAFDSSNWRHPNAGVLESRKLGSKIIVTLHLGNFFIYVFTWGSYIVKKSRTFHPLFVFQLLGPQKLLILGLWNMSPPPPPQKKSYSQVMIQSELLTALQVAGWVHFSKKIFKPIWATEKKKTPTFHYILVGSYGSL